MYFLWYLLIGLAAGWIANLIVKGGGSGLFVNLIVGLIGGVLGGWLFSLFGWVPVARWQSGDGRHRLGHPAVDRRAHLTPQDPLNKRMHEKGGRMTAFSC